MPDVFDRIDAPAGDVFDRISPAAVAKPPRRAGPASTARRQGRVAHALLSPAPTPRPAVNGQQPAATAAAPLFDPHYGLPQAPAAAPATADDLISRALGRQAAPPHHIRMGLAGTGRGSEDFEGPPQAFKVGPVQHIFSRIEGKTKATIPGKMKQRHLTPQEEAAEQSMQRGFPGVVGHAKGLAWSLLEPENRALGITGGPLLGELAPLARTAATLGFGALVGGPEVVEGIKTRDPAKIAAGAATTLLPFAAERGLPMLARLRAARQLPDPGALGEAAAAKIFNRPRRFPDAALQEEQVPGAAAPNVRAGEGGEVSAGRGAGQGAGQQGEPPAGARPPEAEGTPEQAAQGGPQVGTAQEDAARMVVSGKTDPAAFAAKWGLQRGEAYRMLTEAARATEGGSQAILPHEQAAAELLARKGHGPRARADAQAAAKHLETLKAHGYDTGDIQGALDEHAAIKRSDYERGEDGQADYESEKADAWRNVVDAFDGAEHPAAEAAPPPGDQAFIGPESKLSAGKPPTEPPTGEPTEVAPSAEGEPEGISLTNAAMNHVRRAFGHDYFEKPEHVGHAELFQQAVRDKVPDNWIQVAEKGMKHPLDAVEVAGLTLKQAEMINEDADLNTALKAEGLTEQDETAIGARMNGLDAEMDKLTTAANKTGTETARALEARKAMISKDYSPIVQRARLRGAAKSTNRPVKPKDIEKVNKLASEHTEVTEAIQQHEQALAEQRTQAQTAQAEKQVAAAVEQVKRDVQTERQAGRTAKREELSTERAAIRDSIIKKLGRAQTGIPVDVLPDIGRLLRNYVEEGIVDAGAVVDATHDFLKDVFPGVSRQEVADAISGYGYTRQPSKNEIRLKMNDIRRILRAEGRLDDILAGNRPKRTGYQYAPDSPEAARAKREVERAYKAAGMGRASDAARLKAAKKQLVNQEAEYARRLREKDFGPRPKRQPMQLDEEGIALRGRRDAIRDELDAAVQKYQRTGWDAFVALNREWMLSSTAIVEKLLGNTLLSYPTETAADIVGSTMRVFPGIRRLSEISGGREMAPFGRSMRGAYQGARAGASRFAVRNARDMITQGAYGLITDAGAKTHAMELGGYIGRILHGSEKAFLNTAEWKRSMTIRIEHAIEHGRDPDDPAVRAELQTAAAIDGLDQILLGDNKLADGLGRMIGAARSVSPAAGAGLRTNMPITRVPSNLMGKLLEQTGAGFPRAVVMHARALWKERTGTEITPKQATSILRAYKYGGLGLTVAGILYEEHKRGRKMLAGGGFYVPGKKTQGIGDLQPGELMAFGYKIPRQLAHSTQVGAIQWWETYLDALDRASMMLGQERPFAAQAEALSDTLPGLAEQTPGIEATRPLADFFTGRPAERGRAFGRYATQLAVPQAVQGYGSGNVPLPAFVKPYMPGMDVDPSGKPIKRTPKGRFFQQATEQAELAFPWWRGNVEGRYNLDE